jgi:hypothetical protein
MLYTEWNWDDAKAVWQEEAAETAREEAYQDKLESARGLKQDGIPVNVIVNRLNLPLETVEGL